MRHPGHFPITFARSGRRYGECRTRVAIMFRRHRAKTHNNPRATDFHYFPCSSLLQTESGAVYGAIKLASYGMRDAQRSWALHASLNASSAMPFHVRLAFDSYETTPDCW